MQLPRLQLQGTLPRAARPQQLALSQLREKRCDPLVLHRTLTACTSASCMSPSCMQSTGAKRAQTRAHSRRQLHAVDRRQARTDARKLTALSQEWGAQDLVALRVVSAWPKVRKGRGAVCPEHDAERAESLDHVGL